MKSLRNPQKRRRIESTPSSRSRSRQQPMVRSTSASNQRKSKRQQSPSPSPRFIGYATAPPLDDMLPHGWVSASDHNGSVYYVNIDQNIAQWEFPLPAGWRYAADGQFVNSEGVKQRTYPIFGGKKRINRRV